MVSAILTICLSAVFVQTISAQCRGNPGLPIVPIAEALPNNLPYAMPYAPISEQMIIPENAAIFNGGGFQVASFSNVGATGLKVQSDNLIVEGPLSVTGKLPFLGVVTVEGPLPAVGEGAVAYECGNGNVGIMSEGVLGNELGAAAGLPGAAAGMPGIAAGLAGMPGIAAGLAGAAAGIPGLAAGLPGAAAGLPGAVAVMPGAAAGMTGIATGLPAAAAGLPGIGYNQYYNAVGNGMPIGRY